MKKAKFGLLSFDSIVKLSREELKKTRGGYGEGSSGCGTCMDLQGHELGCAVPIYPANSGCICSNGNALNQCG